MIYSYVFLLYSSKFKSFSYLYDEEQFIATLKNYVNIERSLPEYLKLARRKNEFPTFKPFNSLMITLPIMFILFIFNFLILILFGCRGKTNSN
ncbi:hypothetical protein REPUB_Repub11eG0129800 [Reevesia pubescens]